MVEVTRRREQLENEWGEDISTTSDIDIDSKRTTS
jgi:hypothetical protein